MVGRSLFPGSSGFLAIFACIYVAITGNFIIGTVEALVQSSLETYHVDVGDSQITLTKEVFPCPTFVNSDCSTGVLAFLNLHQNENTSVVAARSYLYVHGGSMVKFANKANRLIDFTLDGKKYSFDPNRMFTPEGIKATLQTYSAYTSAAAAEVEKLAAKTLEVYDFDNVETVLALHNNAGTYGANSYLPGGVYENDASKVNIANETNASDFYYVVDDYFFETFAANHYCVVLQNNDTVTNDGSLSYYAGLQGKQYINFESIAEHTSTGQQVVIQLDMIYAAAQAIKDRR